MKSECLQRWPSLRLRCRKVRGRYQVRTAHLHVAFGKSAAQAWATALQRMSIEAKEMRP